MIELPKDIDLEKAVLGAVMIESENDEVLQFFDLIKEGNVFHDSKHRDIFKVLKSLVKDGNPFDMLSVTDKAREMKLLAGIGGAYYLTEVTHRVNSAANLGYHCGILVQLWAKRVLYELSQKISKLVVSGDKDVTQLLEVYNNGMDYLFNQSTTKDFRLVGSLVKQALEEIENARVASRDGNLTGCPSGFTDLDRVTAGWQKSDLIVIGARPGMGKTAFILSAARNACVDFGKTMMIFSLEMSDIQLVKRLLSLQTEVELEKMRTGRMVDCDWEQLINQTADLIKSNLIIDDTPELSVLELRNKAIRANNKYGLDGIIIDYLQLMSGDGKKGRNREQEIAGISRKLKVLAKELDIPVIALCQLSRAVETRGGDKRPMLSDLRESGAIEQDSDMVAFLYRPEYYDITEDEAGQSVRGMGEFIISKHRNGGLATVPLKFTPKLVKYENWQAQTNDLFENAVPAHMNRIEPDHNSLDGAKLIPLNELPK